MKMYKVMNKISAAVISGLLLMPVTQAQQPSDGSTPKQADSELKAGIAKKAGAAKKSGVTKKAEGAGVTVEASALAAAQAQAKEQAEALAAAQVLANKANPFNRTMKPLAKYNLPPVEDGIHDPGNDSTKVLNAPLDAYTDLPRNKAGNRVDWVAALASRKIAPRWDRVDASAEGMVMDMDIVRVPRGSMPNVVFPHKQHTEWLACANCHPAIFVPQKGANQISMSLILSGQKCGVCHGKVAFPPSECTKCHSQKKAASPDEAVTP